MYVYLVGNMQNFIMLNQVLHMVACLVYSDKDNQNSEDAYLLSLEIRLKCLSVQL